MIDPARHPAEDDRQMFVSHELSVERTRAIERHLAECTDCAADVARLERLIACVHEAPAPDAPVDELWPAIRARIDATKVAPLAARSMRTNRGARTIAAAAIVAVIAGVAGAVFVPRIHRSTQGNAPPSAQAAPAADAALTAVADSERLYAEEAQLLLNRLELERSMLRPETARALDRDLRVIDQAIAELKDAIARDPRNPALHQLLASSYRQKAELLKRLGNAG